MDRQTYPEYCGLKADFTKDMIDNIKSSVGYQVFFVVQHVLNDSFGLI